MRVKLIGGVIPQRDDAAVDPGAAAVVFTHFEHQHLGAVIDRRNRGTHAGNAGTDNEDFSRPVPLLRKGKRLFFGFRRKRESASGKG